MVIRYRFFFLAAAILWSGVSVSLNAQCYRAATLAGDDAPLDGPALSALFKGPWQVKVRDTLAYIADNEYNALRELNVRRRTVRTLLKKVTRVSGIAISRTGDSVFFSSDINKINLYRRSTGERIILDTLPDGEIDALECLRNGGLLIGSATGHRVLLRRPDGTYQVLAGKLGVFGAADGLDTLARFNRISSILPSLTEDTLYISDRFNSRLRRLIRSSRQVSTLNLTISLGPRQLAFTRNRDTILLANSSGHTLIRYAVRTNTGSHWISVPGVSGLVNGNASTTRFNFPMGIARCDSGWLVCDNVNRSIRLVSFNGSSTRTFSGGLILGDGIGNQARFDTPYDIVKHPRKDTLYVSDQNGHSVRFVNLRNMEVKTLAGNGLQGNVMGIGAAARFNRPGNMAISETGDSLYVVEPFGNKIKLILTRTGEVKWLAGSDTAGMVDKPQGRFSRFNRPTDLAYRKGVLYVADASNHRIRTVNVLTSAVGTFAGSTSGFRDSTLLSSRFNRPNTLEWVDNRLFVGEDAGLRIRLILPDSNRVRNWAGNGIIGILDGLGSSARFKGILKLSHDPLGKRLFVAGFLNEGVSRVVGTETPEVRTFTNQLGFQDGNLTVARFTGPLAFLVDTADNRYIFTDAGNQRIREIKWFPNNPPSAQVDTTSIFLNEDQEPVFYQGAVSNVSAGNTCADTLQSVAVSTFWTPASRLVNANTDNQGNLFLQTRTDSNGTVMVRLRLFDGGGSLFGGTDTSVYFRRVVIRPVNDAPRIQVAGNDTTTLPGPRVRPGFIQSAVPGPPDEAAQALTLSLTADDPALFEVQPFLEGNSLRYTPVAGQTGTTRVVVRARDDGGTSLNGLDSAEVSFFVILQDPTQVKAGMRDAFRVYPNPASGWFSVEGLPATVSWIGLYSIQGQEIQRFPTSGTGNRFTLPAGLPAGLYRLAAPGHRPVLLRLMP